MTPRQKLLLRDNCDYIREKLNLLPLIDDLVAYEVIEPLYRQELSKCNTTFSTVAWTIFHIIKRVQTERIYEAFMLFLKDKKHDVFEELVRKKELLKTLTGKLVANLIFIHFI